MRSHGRWLGVYLGDRMLGAPWRLKARLENLSMLVWA